ncbi:unnamed protein product [Sphagnum compactum]
MSMESLTASAVRCNPASKTMRVMTSSSTSSSSSLAFVRIPCSSGSLTRLKLMMINNTERTSVSCSALEPESEESSSQNAVPEVLEFQPHSNMPVMPPEWREREEKRKAEEALRNTQGITIRRRPPTGPPLHNVGPFQFKIQSEGNTPRNILEEIVWHKDCEIAQMKERTPLTALAKAMAGVAPTKDFVGTLKARAAETERPALIAEVKKASPSRGVIQQNFDPVRIAQAYEKGGAACLSVLTDSKYFQGSFENLGLIRAAGIQCPLLCKEFIIDAWQIYKARVSGADAVLLIAAVLPDQDLTYMTKIAKALGMAALIEVHSKREMERVLGLSGVELIGINNRSLETFKVDINNTVDLLKGETGQTIHERGIVVVGESGLFTPEDIALVQAAGVGAVLVGESLVKQDDPCAAIAGLYGKDISRKMNNEVTLPVA